MSDRFRALLIILSIGMAALVGCAAEPGAAHDKNAHVNEQAAWEATAIIQRAEATAMVLQAQAKATVLIQNVGAPPAATVSATPTSEARIAEVTRSATPARLANWATAIPRATVKADLSQVQLLGVSFAADGNYIHVSFRAPSRVARQWRQGNVAVIDEATGIIYDGVPVQPLIGPLIAHPVHDGQIGYVMFVNTDSGIHNGSMVTVVLGDFKQKHVIARGNQ